MAENKTKATSVSPASYIAAIADESRRHDCEALAVLMAKASKQPAVMWGSAIVGFGVHKYALASGKQGEICAVGFSSRKADITIYGISSSEAAPKLLDKLGKYKRGKGCVYVKTLADVDLKVFAELVTQAIKSRAS